MSASLTLHGRASERYYGNLNLSSLTATQINPMSFLDSEVCRAAGDDWPEVPPLLPLGGVQPHGQPQGLGHRIRALMNGSNEGRTIASA